MKITFDGHSWNFPEYPQPEDIEIIKDFICPCGWINHQKEGVPIGYCNTQNGYMMVFECPHCFRLTRFHGVTTERYHLDRFKEAVGLWLYLYYDPDEKKRKR